MKPTVPALPLLPPQLPDLPPASPVPQLVLDRLLPWFRQHGRTFPWRTARDPYPVLIAEILLRKTGAPAVARQLPCFLLAYPTPADLARADEDTLARQLAVLGLARQRARQLRRLGNVLVIDYGGKVPGELPELLQLPGAGAYTAAMVAATCFGVRVAAVDTNVARVLCRVFGLQPSHAELRKSANIWQLAHALAQQAADGPAALTWAILDVAAAHCTARRPDHGGCPLRDVCYSAKLEGT